MELDKRIKEGKRPLTCFDAEEAKKYVGKKCYLTNDISLFSDLDVFKDIEGCKSVPNEYDGIINTLSDIDTEISMVFETTYLRWKFCIPCEWVTKEKKEPKYRPFKDHAEYKEYLNDGIIESWIQIREKLTGEVSELMYVGGSEAIICLGAYSFDLNNLFYDFELFNESTCEWQPFGVLEE